VTDLTATATATPLLRERGALWFAYVDYPFVDADAIGAQLRALGFERRVHQTFPDDLALDLYARPGVQVGGAIPSTVDDVSIDRLGHDARNNGAVIVRTAEVPAGTRATGARRIAIGGLPASPPASEQRILATLREESAPITRYTRHVTL